MYSLNERLERLWRKFQAHAHVSHHGNGLAYFRIFVGLYLLTFRGFYWGWLKSIPDSLFAPHRYNLIGLVGSFPSGWLINLADTVYVLMLLCIVLGVRTRLASLVTFFIVIIMNGFSYSLGKIDHEILVNILFLVLAFSNAGVNLALLPDKGLPTKITNRATAFYGIALSFGLFAAGFPKALMWIDWDMNTSGILRWYYEGYYTLGRDQMLAPYFSSVPLFLIEPMEYVVPIFEASGFFFLWRGRRYWRLWICLLCFFHLGNTLVLNISFHRHMLVYGLFLFPQTLPKLLPSPQMIRIVAVVAAMGLGINRLLGMWLLDQPQYFIISQTLMLDVIMWGVLSAIGAYYVLGAFRGSFGGSKAHPSPSTA